MKKEDATERNNICCGEKKTSLGLPKDEQQRGRLLWGYSHEKVVVFAKKLRKRLLRRPENPPKRQQIKVEGSLAEKITKLVEGLGNGWWTVMWLIVVFDRVLGKLDRLVQPATCCLLQRSSRRIIRKHQSGAKEPCDLVRRFT
jgi:hypothetical protein